MSPTPQKLYQQVAERITQAIAEGRYRAGGRLPSERDLAEWLEVSRPTIREAMIALEIRGVVEARHGSGVWILDVQPSAEPVLELDIGAFELTEARRIFEGEACALAAVNITDAEADELEAIVQLMIAENRGDVAGERADRAFHVKIAAITRNAAITLMVETLWDWRYKSPLCATMLARARQAGSRPLIDDHHVILTALRRRDSAGARKAMRSHLDRVIEDLLLATELEAIDRARLEIEAKRADVLKRSVI
ncbi:FadR/GntR family transcriptional regulator [Caulobacter sp. NIBR2454]|uniref:FadR/GntR family transcriptional regulator n=1 Tax=Caulobacter sp. NIBR2454 TaxID=3015996 RepID=UPI0022B66B13|nr:FadR/GntR family transcriptional regulator [Caulobacter sp. NIBR2454]